jgi:hypothetical protein
MMDQAQLIWLTNFIWNIADILALEQETEGLLSEITMRAKP